MQNGLMVKKLAVFLVVLYLAFFSLVSSSQAQGALFVPVAEAVATTVDYSLPYPGILPDSPIYFLKVWRDQVVTWLISDPAQKSFYLLLLSDKRLAAGQMLINSGKIELGVATVAKGEDYFNQATNLAIAAKKSGKDVSDLVAKLTVAGAKHGEVLGILETKVSGKEALDFQKSRQSNTESRKRIMELLLVTGH